MAGWHECKIIQYYNLSKNVISIRLEYPYSNQFQSGQFVMLDLPIDSEFSTRSYSIASAPNAENWIELCIVLKPDGDGTPYIFKNLKEGDFVKVSEPQGRFILEKAEAPICLVCTGTGVAPFRSFIQSLHKEGRLDTEVHLIFGNRTSKDILYQEEWDKLQEDPNFHFYPVLSRAEDSWNGERGYVHKVYGTLATEHPDWIFYLCGWSDMVKEAKNNLKALGFSRKQLKFELYD